MSEGDIWSLYGNIGNHRVVPIRSLCRLRLEGMDPFAIRANLERTRRDAERTAKEIRALDGSEEAAARSEKVSNVLKYWTGRPKDLRQMILNQYGKEYQGTDRDVSTSDYGGESNKCPYEKDPEKRNCWGCHLPRKVWEQMESTYDRER